VYGRRRRMKRMKLKKVKKYSEEITRMRSGSVE
jgi:hypothetical protein